MNPIRDPHDPHELAGEYVLGTLSAARRREVEQALVHDEALRAADTRVRIPMHGNMNSLNASAAAAIVVYEAVRQRSASAQVTAAPL